MTPLHEHYSLEHLHHVVDEMRRLGPPKIRAFWDEETGAWFTFEGTHRLRAALALGLAPVMVPSPWTRGEEALRRARFASTRRGHVFLEVRVEDTP